MRVAKGFTLVELTVTIGMITILAMLAVSAYNSSRGRARDAQRVHDVNEIRSALELYYNRYKSYPTAITAGQAFAAGGITYIDPVPSNPAPRNDGTCGNVNYGYSPTTNRIDYYLSFCLGSAAGELKAGENYCQSSQCINADGDVAAYTARVIADGGEIVDATDLSDAFSKAKTGGWLARDGSMFWVSANFGVKKSGSTIYKWYDIFGNDVNFPSTKEPTWYSTGGPNNKPRLNWAVGDYGTFTSQLSLGTTHDIFDVLKLSANGDRLWFGGNTTANYIEEYNGLFVYQASSYPANTAVTSIQGAFKLINANRAGTTTINYNVNTVAQNSIVIGSNANFNLNEYGSYNGGTLTFYGDRVESILSSTNLSSYRGSINAYLNGKYTLY